MVTYSSIIRFSFVQPFLKPNRIYQHYNNCRKARLITIYLIAFRETMKIVFLPNYDKQNVDGPGFNR